MGSEAGPNSRNIWRQDHRTSRPAYPEGDREHGSKSRGALSTVLLLPGGSSRFRHSVRLLHPTHSRDLQHFHLFSQSTEVCWGLSSLWFPNTCTKTRITREHVAPKGTGQFSPSIPCPTVTSPNGQGRVLPSAPLLKSHLLTCTIC